ncbi:MAG: hypothetical protein O8C66_11750 [Candidatus Methanoperedens sp.]|nr:hypothetical protein [Candidatus Methanoperedens sp.]MCZ7371176.1 hypothetical protein [Candidatus Methanoperedens sp.]
MRTKSLFLIFLLGSLVFFSGCLREYNNVEVTSVDIMSSPQDKGAILTVTPYIQNNQNSDTGILTLQVKIREPSSNLMVAEKDSDIGYIKGKSGSSSSVTMTVSNAGEYGVEVLVLEGGKTIAQSYSSVLVKPKPGPGEPADIKLTDMNLVVTKIYNDASGALVDVSPGIYNQGGDSKPLTVEVTARVDAYTAYTKTDDIGIIKGASRVRGKVTFDIPRNREYTFSVSVTESGKNVVGGTVPDKIKLSEVKFNTPMTYVLVEEGKPVAAAATATSRPKEPGFEITMAMIGILIVYGICHRIRR